MFLNIPVSIIVPEILEHLEDADFEDWLTADLFANASRLPLKDLCANGAHHSAVGSVDVWMVEITQRGGKLWNGKFQVEFTEEQSGGSKSMAWTEHRSGELLFALDTESAEIVFVTNVDGEN
jgi:hypothetical protein